MMYPVWSGHYGSLNTIYVNANLFATVSESSGASWTTATSGGSNNLTFTSSVANTVITIPSSQLNGFTLGSSGTCTISTGGGTCTISVTNVSGFPIGTNYFSYIASPSGSQPNGIIQQASFTYSS